MVRAFRLAFALCLLSGPALAACEDLHWVSDDGVDTVTWHPAQNLAFFRIGPQSQGGVGARAGDADMYLYFTPLEHGDPQGRFWTRNTVRISVSPSPVYDLSGFGDFQQRIGFGDGGARAVDAPRNDPFSTGPDNRLADRWWTDLRDQGVSAPSRGPVASDALERMRREGSLRVEQLGRRDGRRQVIAFGEFGFGRFAPLWTRLQAHRTNCPTSSLSRLSDAESLRATG